MAAYAPLGLLWKMMLGLLLCLSSTTALGRLQPLWLRKLRFITYIVLIPCLIVVQVLLPDFLPVCLACLPNLHIIRRAAARARPFSISRALGRRSPHCRPPPAAIDEIAPELRQLGSLCVIRPRPTEVAVRFPLRFSSVHPKLSDAHRWLAWPHVARARIF